MDAKGQIGAELFVSTKGPAFTCRTYCSTRRGNRIEASTIAIVVDYWTDPRTAQGRDTESNEMKLNIDTQYPNVASPDRSVVDTAARVERFEGRYGRHAGGMSTDD